MPEKRTLRDRFVRPVLHHMFDPEEQKKRAWGWTEWISVTIAVTAFVVYKNYFM